MTEEQQIPPPAPESSPSTESISAPRTEGQVQDYSTQGEQQEKELVKIGVTGRWQKTEYDLFISHGTEEGTFDRILLDILYERLHKQKRCFLDYKHPTGSSIDAKVMKYLRVSKFLLPIVTERYLDRCIIPGERIERELTFFSGTERVTTPLAWMIPIYFGYSQKEIEVNSPQFSGKKGYPAYLKTHKDELENDVLKRETAADAVFKKITKRFNEMESEVERWML